MKRIITCSDGTWNKPNSKYKGKPIRTNVQKLFNCIEKNDGGNVRQIKYYDEGIGAEGNFITRMVNGATGKGIDENILDIYRFIVWNYEQVGTTGDEIWLFGFSRGAYTARSLAGMIRKCGILRVNDLDLFRKAYSLYRNKNIAPRSPEAVEFRKQYCFEDVKIKFIGVWDTVGSLGIPLNIFQWYNERKYTFYDTALSSMVEYAYHAVAVDEQRGNFAPALWTRSDNPEDHGFTQTLEQQWFAGVHSNVGGGYPDEGLSDITLNWMIQKASRAGLVFDETKVKETVSPEVLGQLYDSRSGIFAWLPGAPREIKEGPLNGTVREKMLRDPTYKPRNVKTLSEA